MTDDRTGLKHEETNSEAESYFPFGGKITLGYHLMDNSPPLFCVWLMKEATGILST